MQGGCQCRSTHFVGGGRQNPAMTGISRNVARSAWRRLQARTSLSVALSGSANSCGPGTAAAGWRPAGAPPAPSIGRARSPVAEMASSALTPAAGSDRARARNVARLLLRRRPVDHTSEPVSLILRLAPDVTRHVRLGAVVPFDKSGPPRGETPWAGAADLGVVDREECETSTGQENGNAKPCSELGIEA